MNDINPHSDIEIAAQLADDVALPAATVEQIKSLPIPRLDSWFGAWCIEPITGLAMMEHIGRMDMTAHVRDYQTQSRDYVDLYCQAEGSEEILAKLPMAPSGPSVAAATKSGSTIAVIDIMGTLMKADSSLGSSSSTVALRQAIRQAMMDDSIDGIMLRIDSPGGTVSGTSDLADAIAQAGTKKPVWAFGEDLVASAALWLASQADQFFANSKTANIGSIGTVIGLYDTSGAAGQQGIKAKVYATGPLKGAGFPGAEITPAQDQYFQSIVEQTQTHFRDAVSKGRKLPVATVRSLETGGLFSATEAQTHGLIDGIQSFDKTMAAMFRTIKSRQSAASSMKGADMAATQVSIVTETTTQAEAAPAFDRQAVITEMNSFVARFGAENGTKWFGEGINMNEALGRHCEVLNAKLIAQAEEFAKTIEAKDAEIADLKTRLSQVKLGETEPVSQTDAEKAKTIPTDAFGRPLSARERAIAATKADMAAALAARNN